MSDEEIIHFDAYSTIFVGTVRGTTRLDATNAPEFAAALDAFVESHSGVHLLLNFHPVEYMSSVILSAIVKAHKALEKNGGSMRVCALNPNVANVFQITQLDTLFHPMPQVRQAAEAYIQWVEDPERQA